MVDPEVEPETVPFDPPDMPDGPFVGAALAWHDLRQGKPEANTFGVAPGLPYKGDWFIRNYLILKLAALNKRELLWDWWGAMSDSLAGDLGLIDEAARLILQSDAAWPRWLELFERPEFAVPDEVTCYSPTGKVQTVQL